MSDDCCQKCGENNFKKFLQQEIRAENTLKLDEREFARKCGENNFMKLLVEEIGEENVAKLERQDLQPYCDALSKNETVVSSRLQQILKQKKEFLK